MTHIELVAYSRIRLEVPVQWPTSMTPYESTVLVLYRVSPCDFRVDYDP